MRVELVKDRATQEPLSRKVTERIFMECALLLAARVRFERGTTALDEVLP
jgi:hypothetical protein